MYYRFIGDLHYVCLLHTIFRNLVSGENEEKRRRLDRNLGYNSVT